MMPRQVGLTLATVLDIIHIPDKSEYYLMAVASLASGGFTQQASHVAQTGWPEE
jgi:hypothetical protein